MKGLVGTGTSPGGAGDALVAHVLLNTIGMMQVRLPQPQKYLSPELRICERGLDLDVALLLLVEASPPLT